MVFEAGRTAGESTGIVNQQCAYEYFHDLPPAAGCLFGQLNIFEGDPVADVGDAYPVEGPRAAG